MPTLPSPALLADVARPRPAVPFVGAFRRVEPVEAVPVVDLLPAVAEAFECLDLVVLLHAGDEARAGARGGVQGHEPSGVASTVQKSVAAAGVGAARQAI